MAVIPSAIFEIINKYPEYREEIIHFHKNSHSFRSMCEDLCTCRNAYHHWIKSESGEAKQRSDEYRELLENLECEINRYITETSTELLRPNRPDTC